MTHQSPPADDQPEVSAPKSSLLVRLSPNARIGRKIQAAFGLLAALLVVNTAVSHHFSAKAEHAWESTEKWTQLRAAAATQIDGLLVQQATQASYLITGEERFKKEWLASADDVVAAWERLLKLEDPQISKFAKDAETADLKHDKAVTEILFPAVARGDQATALKALADADENVRIVTEITRKVGPRIEQLRKADVDEAKSLAATASKVSLGFAILGILGSIIAGLALTRIITAPVSRFVAALKTLVDHDIKSLDNGLNALRDGDLTAEAGYVVEPIVVKGRDEIAEATVAVNDLVASAQHSIDSYNTARGSLAALIGRVSASATTISQASNLVATSSEEAGSAVTEIAHAVGSVAEGAHRQVVAVEKAREVSREVHTITEQSAADASATAEVADEARRLATAGGEAAEEATAVMQAVSEASAQATEAIRMLGEKSDEIGSIVSTITAIAEQTNLLALNAAIEAARAGEQGRGFAVVAEEVRKLAEESQSATGTIETLIAEIQRETGHAVKAVEAGAERTASGVETVERTRTAFSEISGAVDDVSARAGQIAAAVQQISESAQTLADTMNEVAAVADESSASSEQVSASSEQTSASTHEISNSAQSLAQTAAELDTLAGEFKLA